MLWHRSSTPRHYSQREVSILAITFQSCTISIPNHYVTFPSLNWLNVLDVSQGKSQWLSRYSDSGIQTPAAARDVSSPKRPDRLWTPLSLPLKGYSGTLLQVLSGREVRVICYLRLVPRLKMGGALPPRHLYASVILFFFALRSLWCGVVWCAASPSSSHSRLEQVLIPALCMPIQKIMISNLAPDNGYSMLGFRLLAQYIPTTTGLQKVSTSKQLVPLCNDRCTCATRHMEQPTLVYCQQHSARQGHMTPTTAYSLPVTNFLLIYRRSFLRCRDVLKPLSD